MEIVGSSLHLDERQIKYTNPKQNKTKNKILGRTKYGVKLQNFQNCSCESKFETREREKEEEKRKEKGVSSVQCGMDRFAYTWPP